MPTYDYECLSCSYVFELFQQMSAKQIKKCPECGKNTVKRHIGAGMGIIFKGSGFYETDYKRNDKTGSGGRTPQNNKVKEVQEERAEKKTENVKDSSKETKPNQKSQNKEKDNSQNG